MKIKFQYILVGLTLLSCSDSYDKLSGKNLYAFTENEVVFPNKLKQNKNFYDVDRFSDILKRLDEKSLCDKYSGHEIVRLTVIRSFRNHFTILIKRTDDEVQITEKETYRDSKPVNNGDTTKITYDVIEFDSLTGKYMEVRKFMPIGTGTAIEIETARKVIDPLIKNKSTRLKSKDWNNLTALLTKTSFWEMYPADSTFGFDGNHYILEAQSKDGYYVVDRLSPEAGDFKTIVDFIIGLSDYQSEAN